MEVKELRLGNYILGWFQNNDGMFQEAIGLNLLVFNEIANWPEHDYEPIPLTEKWLLKFGFIKEKKNRKYVYLFDGFELEQSPSGEIWFENRCGTVIKYIHQLQNLYFAITAEELTIKE